VAEGTEERRANYRHSLEIATRWMDNDVYGHVNNVVYYSYFDTVVNRYLIDAGDLDIHGGAMIGLAVESQCRFHRSLAFPDRVDACLRAGTLGRTSVRYEIGLFRQREEEPAATGYLVHVFVDRETRRPAPIAGQMREALERLLISE